VAAISSSWPSVYLYQAASYRTIRWPGQTQGQTLPASIGTAAVPGAGMVMLIVILEGVWPADAAVSPVPAFLLILSVDRILDMCRTTVNVTGDATVATIIAHSEKQLHLDKPAD